MKKRDQQLRLSLYEQDRERFERTHYNFDIFPPMLCKGMFHYRAWCCLPGELARINPEFLF